MAPQPRPGLRKDYDIDKASNSAAAYRRQSISFINY